MKRPALLAVTAAGVLLGPVLAGCSTVDSGDLRTSGIEATITVVADSDPSGGGQDVDVRVYLGTGGLSSVHLEGDDQLVASAGGKSTTLHEDTFLGTRDYEGTLPVDPDPGTKVTVALDRSSKDTDAPHSTVDLPTAVRVVSPAAGSTFRRSRDLTFTTNPGPGTYRVTWDGPCVVTSTDGVTSVAGSPVSVPRGYVQPVKGAPRSCPVTFHVTRILEGRLDDAYKSGDITSERTTSISLTVRP